jgi:hypothetical protein
MARFVAITSPFTTSHITIPPVKKDQQTIVNIAMLKKS